MAAACSASDCELAQCNRSPAQNADRLRRVATHRARVRGDLAAVNARGGRVALHSALSSRNFRLSWRRPLCRIARKRRRWPTKANRPDQCFTTGDCRRESEKQSANSVAKLLDATFQILHSQILHNQSLLFRYYRSYSLSIFIVFAV